MSKSILHDKRDGTCYLCIHLRYDYSRRTCLEEHHVIGGNPGRKHSEHYGLKVYLCRQHHTDGPEAVHNNAANMRFLQRKAQEVFEQKYSHEKWMEVFGQNFL